MFNEHEKQIIIFGKESGKSPEQIQTAVAKYRAGIVSQPAPVATTPKTTAEKVSGALGFDGAVDTFGSIIARAQANPEDRQNIPKPTLKQTLGSVAQVGSLAIPGTTLLRGAAIGATQMGGQAASNNESAASIAAKTAGGGILGPVLGMAGKALSKVGQTAYEFVLPRSAKEAQFIQTYRAKLTLPERFAHILSSEGGPQTSARTAFNQSLVGTEGMLGVQGKKAANTLWSNVIAPRLDDAESVNMQGFFMKLRQEVVDETPELSRQSTLLKALDALQDDYQKLGAVSFKKLQEFKEGWAEFVPEKAYKGEAIAGAFNDIKDKAADLARRTIYDRLGPDVRQAYFDYGNLQAIQKLGQTAMTGGRLKGGSFTGISAIKDMFLTPIGTLGGLVIYGVGRGIQLIGPRGLSTVGQLLETPSTTGEDGQQPTLEPTTPQTQEDIPSQNPTTSPQTSKAQKIFSEVHDTVAADPLIGMGLSAKAGKVSLNAADIMKDALLEKLKKGAPSLSKAMNLPKNIEEEAAIAAKNLESKANPTQEDLNDALEIARMMGHDVRAIAEAYIKASQTAFEQVRNKFGRFTDEIRRK